MGAAAVVASLAIVASASADPPTRVTIVAVFSPITYGDNAYVNGQLFGTGQAGQPVILEQATPPAFVDWTPIGQVNSDAAAYYSFKLRPTQTMQYRTSSQTAWSVPRESAAFRVMTKLAEYGSDSVVGATKSRGCLNWPAHAIFPRSSTLTSMTHSA